MEEDSFVTNDYQMNLDLFIQIQQARGYSVSISGPEHLT